MKDAISEQNMLKPLRIKEIVPIAMLVVYWSKQGHESPPHEERCFLAKLGLCTDKLFISDLSQKKGSLLLQV